MAQEFFGFFDGVTGDERSYVADQLAAAFRTLATDGVRALGTCLRVESAQDGMKTRVLPGGALLRGYLYELQDDGGAYKTFTHAASGSAPRIDRVTLRLDLDTDARCVTMAVKTGTPAAEPEPPALARTGTVWEISLAQVRIPAASASVTAADIVDERADEAVCGVIVPHTLTRSALSTSHAHAVATASAAGFMSAADKDKMAWLAQDMRVTAAPTFAGLTVSGVIRGARFE